MAKTTPPASNGARGTAITTNQLDREDQAQATAAGEEQPAQIMRSMVRQLRPAILLTLLLALIVGVIYPLVVTAIGQAAFSSQANGSIVYVNGKPVGSKLIGQYWTQAQYFHGRPSATLNLQGTPSPYQADNSGASNLGPTNSTLIKTVQQRIADLKAVNPDVPFGTPVPVDLVTASGSGLDPDISVAAAYYQIPRVAKARNLTQQAVRNIVDAHIQGRFLGVFGEPRINVLELNMALDAASH